MGEDENLNNKSLEIETRDCDENSENFQEQEIGEAKTSVMCPQVGMEFESQHEAYSYYNSYARCVGFGTKRHSTRKSQRNGDVIGHRFCCICQGVRNSKRKFEELQRIRGCFRTNCKAMMAIKKGKNGNWIVSHVIKEHNHALATPSNVHNFRSHRNIGHHHAEVIKKMHSVGVRTDLTLEAKGHRNLGFKQGKTTQADCDVPVSIRTDLTPEAKGHRNLGFKQGKTTQANCDVPVLIRADLTLEAKGHRNLVFKQGKTTQAECDVPVSIRFNNICREANNIAVKASVNQHVYNIAIDGLHNTLMNVECALKNMVSIDKFEEVEKLEDMSHMSKLDPLVQNHIGRPKNLKSFLDNTGKDMINSTNQRSSKKLMENATSVCEEIETQNRNCSQFSQVADKSLTSDVANISENLEENQDHTALSGVPSEISAEPNDTIVKVFGSEHPACVRRLGVGVCPPSVLGLQASLVSFGNTSISSDKVAQNRVEDLANKVSTLEENFTACRETKLELLQTQAKLNTLYKFLQEKFGSDVPNLDKDGLH